MPYVADIVKKFKKQYGKNWEQRYFAWQNANPKAYAKGVATARNRGDKIISTFAKTKAGKVRSKKNG